jgi:3'-phosphoadenosine 5'-phosphosulfate (PAPS) 3'-phosphatase
LRRPLDAAHAAADVVRHYYQRNLKVTIKADKSPVTEADVETEKTIRSILGAKFPGHGFYGEETGTQALDAEYVWIVDPIDGTKAFVREYPMFSTQIALMRGGTPDRRCVVGPGLRRAGLWRDRCRRMAQRAADSRQCRRHDRGRHTFDGQSENPGYRPALARVRAARGKAQSHPRLRRFSALSSAGGRSHRCDRRVRCQHPRRGRVRRDRRSRGRPFTDLEGSPLSLTTGSVLASNGLLHGQVHSAINA